MALGRRRLRRVRDILVLALMAVTISPLTAAAQPTAAISADPSKGGVEKARTALEAVRRARPGGLTLTFLDLLRDYQKAVFALYDGIRRMPDVQALDGEIQAARAGLDAAIASPAATELEIAGWRDRLAAAEEAMPGLIATKQAEILASLNLEPFTSPELFAAGQTAYFDPFPPNSSTGAHGPQTDYYPDAPWQVELQWAGFDAHQPTYAPEELHACGGALVAPNWVLTAAHCDWDRKTNGVLPTSALRVRGGAKVLSELSPPVPIQQIIVHPDYRVSSLIAPAQADLALLRLARAMPLNDPRSLSVIPYARSGFQPPRTPEAVTASGWGATDELSFQDQVRRISVNGRLTMSPELRIVPQRVFDQGECAEEIRDRIYASDKSPPPVTPVHPGNLCAGGSSGTCQGDSGGPLVAHTNMHARRHEDYDEPYLRGRDRPVVFGVVSWGAGCKAFTVFTRVSFYSDWIDRILASGGKEPEVPLRPVPTEAQPALARSSS